MIAWCCLIRVIHDDKLPESGANKCHKHIKCLVGSSGDVFYLYSESAWFNCRLGLWLYWQFSHGFLQTNSRTEAHIRL